MESRASVGVVWMIGVQLALATLVLALDHVLTSLNQRVRLNHLVVRVVRSLAQGEFLHGRSHT